MIQLTEDQVERMVAILDGGLHPRDAHMMRLELASLLDWRARVSRIAASANKNDRQQQHLAILRCLHLSIQLREKAQLAREHLPVLPDVVVEQTTQLEQYLGAAVAEWSSICEDVSSTEDAQRPQRGPRLIEVD
jgi:hypothetical protein